MCFCVSRCIRSTSRLHSETSSTTPSSALELSQLAGVPFLCFQEMLGAVEHGLTVGPDKIDVGDGRILAGQGGFGLEGVGNLGEEPVMTNLVLDEQVDEIPKGLRLGLLGDRRVLLEQTSLCPHVAR